MKQDFTPRAQRLLALAREEAHRLHHNFVGTEHLFLGLVKLGQGGAVDVLEKLEVDLEAARIEVENVIAVGPARDTTGNIPFTPRVKKVLAIASKAAEARNQPYVGTEHILLGILREGDGVAAKVLKGFGVDDRKATMEITQQYGLDCPASVKDTESMEESQKGFAAPEAQSGSIDTTRRYDVYCSERNAEVIVYRNVLFKGRSKLLSTQPNDPEGEFVAWEQSNGQTVYVSLRCVIRFCEHGGTILGAIVPHG